MQPRTQEVLSHLDANRDALQHAVDAVPQALRARRPAPDSWSVAEVLEHLALVEGRVTGMLADKLTEARAAGLGPEQDSAPVVPTVDVAGLVDRTQIRTASEASTPTGAVGADAAWETLSRVRRGLHELVAGADGLALGSVMLPHARLGELNVYQWLVFIGAHEARHVVQVREAAEKIAAG
ncbi:MAG: DinB family protein [Gemmatimonadaceae bacterium]